MSSTKFLLIILAAPLFSPAQVIKEKVKPSSAFSNGNWNFPLERTLDILHRTEFDDNGNKAGRRNEVNLNIDQTYFVADHFGINLDYCLDWWCEDDDYSDREWSGRLGLVYGTTLTNMLGFYGEVGGIYGRDRLEQPNQPPNFQIEKSNQSGYFFEAGLPIYLGGYTYLTPRVDWSHVTTDYGFSEEKKNSFGFNVGLEAYLGGKKIMCDHKNGYSFSKNKYDQGNSFFNFQSMGNFKFGSEKTIVTNPPFSSEDDFSGAHLSFNYRYYFMDNLALGAKFNFRTQTQEGPNSSFKNTNSNWSVSPRITYNFPLDNGWNNWFVEAGVGFGSKKSKTNIGNSGSEIKFNNFNYGVWTGYNFWFSDRLSFTPQFGYTSASSKNTSANTKTETHSLNLELGTQFQFTIL